MGTSRSDKSLSELVTETQSKSEQHSITSFPVRKPEPVIAFDRHELQVIMGLYGRMVAAGEWRDYAMDFLSDMAVFSIFRRSSEMPLYRIVKDPELRNKQGMYSVHAPGGLVLKRGANLAQIMRVIDKPVRSIGL
jgi:Protein of unknown function (DUF2794)